MMCSVSTNKSKLVDKLGLVDKLCSVLTKKSKLLVKSGFDVIPMVYIGGRERFAAKNAAAKRWVWRC